MAKNLETYSLLWLDALVNSQENSDAQQKLRSSINQVEVFQQSGQCEKRIRSVSPQDRIILIVSGRLGQQLVPRIHQLRQISSIYVYCMDKEKNQLWANHCNKVKGVIGQLDKLIAQIQSDQKGQVQNKVDEPIIINIFNTNAGQGQSSTGLNGQFVHSQLLIDCLLRMKSTSTDKNELSHFCQKEYQGNNAQLTIVREFQQNYSSDRSIWWYTRESFLYRLLNKALRVQNIDVLFLFRFFIRDIERQLHQHRCLSPVRLYRGQLMANEELQILRNSIGELISMNSFLSTSINRKRALAFLHSSNFNDDIQRVLFEIEADPRLKDIKPFANITSLSYYPKEEEVLMMVGSIFRLNKIFEIEDRVWIIRMTLCSDSDHDLKEIFCHMKKELAGDGETSLYSFSAILHKMGKFDDAEKYYHKYLQELPSDHGDIAHCYWGLGDVAYDKGDCDLSLKWHRKSLEIKMQTLKSNDPSLGHSHKSIANVHRKKGDFKQALESYKDAWRIWKHAFGENHPLVAVCFNNIGIIYKLQKNYPKALWFYKKDLVISQNHLPRDHPDLGKSHHNIANVHYSLGEYDLALEHYRLSLKIFEKSLPSQHPHIAATFASIGLVHEQKGNFREALSFYEKAITIYRQKLPPAHPNVIHIEQDVRRVSARLK